MPSPTEIYMQQLFTPRMSGAPATLAALRQTMAPQQPGRKPQAGIPVQDTAATTGYLEEPMAEEEPLSGREMEKQSRSSIDTILDKMVENQAKNHENDRHLAWLSFFSKLASSTNPTISGALGEAGSAMADTAAERQIASRKDESDLDLTKIKYQEWLKEQQAKEAENASEAALRQAQAKYYGSAAKVGGIAPADVREWQYFNNLSPDDQKRYMDLKRRQAEEAGNIKLSEKTNEGIAENFTTKRKAAEDANLSLKNNAQARKLLDEGVITGAGADYIKGFGKALNQAGISYDEDEIANTEAFVASRGAEVGRLIKQFGSGTGLSDADRDFAERMAAGKISLTEKSIRKIMEMNDTAARNTISLFNEELKKMPKSIVPYDISVKEYAPSAGGEKTIVKTQTSPSTGKKRIIYSDGTEEIQ